MALRHLVRVHLKAERIKTYLCQTTLHHAESCHFLGNKEYTLTLEQGISDEVGDGLRLTRTWRTIEYKGMTESSLKDCRHLRRVNGNRQGKLVRTHLLILIT